MGKYYDSNKLLQLKDLDGDTPEIFICVTNRTAGKTTHFNKLLFKRWVNEGAQFCLLYRYDYEISGSANQFFGDIGPMFFPGYQLRNISCARGAYYEIQAANVPEPEPEDWCTCGYAVSLNGADKVKKNSHVFSRVQSILFDEFQPENSGYTSKEINKFRSIHTSIARGQGQQVRYVPVYMVSNPISLINPYYTQFGIGSRLRKNTKFLRGHGWVMEQGLNESASEAQLSSAFNKAFKNDKYLAYSANSVYLSDTGAFIEKVEGRSDYLATIIYKGENYGIRQFTNKGVVYCDNRPDMSFPHKLAVTTEDHDINYVLLRNNDMFIQLLRYYFEKGCFRFRDVACKEAIMGTIGYY